MKINTPTLKVLDRIARRRGVSRARALNEVLWAEERRAEKRVKTRGIKSP